MKIKILCFDTLIFFFILALMFAIGFGIGRGRDEETKELLTVELSMTVKKGTLTEGEILSIDGKIPVVSIRIGEFTAELQAEAIKTPAGWLLPSGKYISENQPLKVYSDTSYIEGRIKSISKNA